MGGDCFCATATAGIGLGTVGRDLGCGALVCGFGVPELLLGSGVRLKVNAGSTGTCVPEAEAGSEP